MWYLNLKSVVCRNLFKLECSFFFLHMIKQCNVFCSCALKVTDVFLSHSTKTNNELRIQALKKNRRVKRWRDSEKLDVSLLFFVLHSLVRLKKLTPSISLSLHRASLRFFFSTICIHTVRVNRSSYIATPHLLHLTMFARSPRLYFQKCVPGRIFY